MDRTFPALVEIESFRQITAADIYAGGSWKENSVNEKDDFVTSFKIDSSDVSVLDGLKQQFSKTSTPKEKKKSVWDEFRSRFMGSNEEKSGQKKMATENQEPPSPEDDNEYVSILDDSGYSQCMEKSDETFCDGDITGDITQDELLYTTALEQTDIEKCLMLNIFHNCDGHPNNAKLFYCLECKVSLCVICKTQFHNRHKYTTVDSAALQRRGEMKRGLVDLEEKCDRLTGLIFVANTQRDHINQQHAEIGDKLQAHRSFLHSMVDRWYDRSNFQLETACSTQIAKLNTSILSLEAAIDDMKDTMEHINQLMDYNGAADILSLSSDVHNHMLELQEQDYLQDPKHLRLAFNPDSNLDFTSFGTLTTAVVQGNEDFPSPLTQGTLVSSFCARQTPNNSHMATGLALNRVGNIIVTDIGSDSVQIFNFEGKRRVTFNTLPQDQPVKAVEVEHMDTTMYVVGSKSGLKIFDKKGNFARKLPLNLSCAQALAATPTGDIIVGVTSEQGSALHLLDTATWSIKHSIVGGLRAPVFTSPWYVTSTKQENIIVSDYAEHNIKVFSNRGILIHEFGRKGAGHGEFFHPAGLCVDKYGQILIADCYNNRIQMFSIRGEFLGIVLGEEDVSFPSDLLVNDLGQLIVLQGDGHVKTFAYAV